MSTIKCSKKLWRVVRGWGLPSNTDQPLGSDLLQAWAATHFQEDEIDVVIAITESTYLTVVFPTPKASDLSTALREAVAAALSDLHVPALRIQEELAGLGSVSVRPLNEPKLNAVLRDLEMYCGIELSYHSDLRIVQRNLNDVPHASLEGYVPALAVARRLRRASRHRRMNGSGSAPP